MGAKYNQLDLDERIEMSRLHEAGTSRREIGRIIGRSASTVGRELRRNTLGGAKGLRLEELTWTMPRKALPSRGRPAALIDLGEIAVAENGLER